METIAITVFQVSVNVCIFQGCLHYKGVLEPYLRILFKGKRTFRISCLKSDGTYGIITAVDPVQIASRGSPAPHSFIGHQRQHIAGKLCIYPCIQAFPGVPVCHFPHGMVVYNNRRTAQQGDGSERQGFRLGKGGCSRISRIGGKQGLCIRAKSRDEVFVEIRPVGIGLPPCKIACIGAFCPSGSCIICIAGLCHISVFWRGNPPDRTGAVHKCRRGAGLWALLPETDLHRYQALYLRSGRSKQGAGRFRMQKCLW